MIFTKKPEKKYEREGLVKNVVFTCGAIEWKDIFYIYYGGADSVVGVAYISKKNLLDYLREKIHKGGV